MTEQTKSVELYTLSTCPWSRKALAFLDGKAVDYSYCLLYTSPSPRDS